MALLKVGELQANRRIIGQRIRKQRIAAGLSQVQFAKVCGLQPGTIRAWEGGAQMPRQWDFPSISEALNCPVAQLLIDDLVLAEVRVSPETLERVKREGSAAADEVAQRIAANLSALLQAEASRPPLNLEYGARARKRRSRAEVLADEQARQQRKAAGIAAARASQNARQRTPVAA